MEGKTVETPQRTHNLLVIHLHHDVDLVLDHLLSAHYVVAEDHLERPQLLRLPEREILLKLGIANCNSIIQSILIV